MVGATPTVSFVSFVSIGMRLEGVGGVVLGRTNGFAHNSAV